jgi:hypothetical protein
MNRFEPESLEFGAQQLDWNLLRYVRLFALVGRIEHLIVRRVLGLFQVAQVNLPDRSELL